MNAATGALPLPNASEADKRGRQISGRTGVVGTRRHGREAGICRNDDFVEPAVGGMAPVQMKRLERTTR